MEEVLLNRVCKVTAEWGNSCEDRVWPWISPHTGVSPLPAMRGQGLQISYKSFTPWFSMSWCELCVTQDHNICRSIHSYPQMQSRQLTRCPPEPLHRTLLFPSGPCRAVVTEHVGSRPCLEQDVLAADM